MHDVSFVVVVESLCQLFGLCRVTPGGGTGNPRISCRSGLVCILNTLNPTYEEVVQRGVLLTTAPAGDLGSGLLCCDSAANEVRLVCLEDNGKNVVIRYPLGITIIIEEENGVRIVH